MTMGRVEPNTRRSISWLLLIVIVLAGFFVRLYDYDDPPLDFHGTRQLRSLLLARDIYLRSADDVSADVLARSAQVSELESYEPPIMEHLLALVYRLAGRELPMFGRVFSSFFWALGGVFCWLIVAPRFGTFAGCVSLAIYFFFPMSVVMTRAIQPDPWMCTWIVATLWAALRMAETGRVRDWALTALFGGLAILIKAFAGFFVGGILAGLMLVRMGDAANGTAKKRLAVLVRTIVAGSVMLLPGLVYALSLGDGRSGDFLSFWVVSLGGMVFTSGFYADWLAMIKGLLSLPLLAMSLAGLLILPKRMMLPVGGAWAGYVLYGLTVPYQVTTHEYYSLMIFPLAALSVAPVAALLWKTARTFDRVRPVLLSVLVALSAGYGAYVACGRLRGADYRLEPVSWRRAGEAIPADARVIGLTGDYGMRLNYYGWRRLERVWGTSGDHALFELANRAPVDIDALFRAETAEMDYFFVSAFNELANEPALAERLAKCPVAAEGNGFVLYDLRAACSDDPTWTP